MSKIPRGFPGSSAGKESACNAGDLVQFLGQEDPWRTSLGAQVVKCLPSVQETWVQSLGQEDPLEKEMATHSSVLALRIPETGKPGRLPSMGSHRVGHN